MPLALWPPREGSRGAGGACWDCLALPEAVVPVVLVPELAALAMAEPPRAAAPIATSVVR